jgi:putative radical SAM enzyme (TIGR03279 family)
MPPARVLAVAPGSPAARAGLEAGDEILSVNGEDLRDVIRYQIQADEPEVELELRRGGLERLVVVEKAAGEPLGAELESAVFDRVRTCDNHCPFCFIYQLPKGMRKSLYMKDDDYRLSFLYGNFTTLTRFTEADLERVVTEGLGPLYVSIHATDPEVRTRLLRNRRGATSLRWLAALLDAGIEVHGQVVVCPGVNDGDVLDDTMLGLLDRFPKLASVGVVPLGVSSHSREESMRPHTVAEAERVVDIVDEWQARFTEILGHRLVYAADEYYLMAGRPFPPAAAYEGFAQHENGIGMARTFTTEVRAALDGHTDEAGTGPRSGFFSWVEGAPAEGYRAPRTVEPVTTAAPAPPATAPVPNGPDAPVRVTLRPSRTAPVVIITGTYGEQVLEPLLGELVEGTGAQIRLLPVANSFFGGNIGVTGLLTAADVSAALAAEPEGRRYLLPDVVLSNGVFLDGGSVDDLPRPVEIVPTDGVSLVAALRAGSTRLVPA